MYWRSVYRGPTSKFCPFTDSRPGFDPAAPFAPPAATAAPAPVTLLLETAAPATATLLPDSAITSVRKSVAFTQSLEDRGLLFAVRSKTGLLDRKGCRYTVRSAASEGGVGQGPLWMRVSKRKRSASAHFSCATAGARAARGKPELLEWVRCTPPPTATVGPPARFTVCGWKKSEREKRLC